MGTRNLTCVYLDGAFRVAQYGQFYGYPSGVGLTVLNFLRKNPTIDRKEYPTNEPSYGVGGVVYKKASFKKNLLACKFISDEEVEARWKKVGAENGFSTLDQDDLMRKKYPQLQRDMGGLVLAYIQKKGGVELHDSLYFAGDSLFCEWAYVIDYDANVLEAYKGFVKSDQGGRFARYFRKRDKVDEKSKIEQYYPIALEQSWPLDKLPTKQEFLKALNDEG